MCAKCWEAIWSWGQWDMDKKVWMLHGDILRRKSEKCERGYIMNLCQLCSGLKWTLMPCSTIVVVYYGLANPMTDIPFCDCCSIQGLGHHSTHQESQTEGTPASHYFKQCHSPPHLLRHSLPPPECGWRDWPASGQGHAIWSICETSAYVCHPLALIAGGDGLLRLPLRA